jgi:hypothetical protein
VRQLKTGALATGFPTELWSLPRIAQLIEQRFAVRLTQPSVWRLLRALGCSVQRPTGQARQRDEKAIRTWKAKRWPEPKRSQRDKGGCQKSCVRAGCIDQSPNTNRSPNWMASWALAACHAIGGRFQFSVMCRSASQISLVAA